MISMSDLKPLGSTEGIAYYWIQQHDYGSSHLALVAVDELGHVTTTGARSAYDEAAPTQQEAVLDHLAPAIAQADAHLERRRQELPLPELKPEPVSPATQRFLDDGDY